MWHRKWQDWVIMAVDLAFAPALVPMILGGVPPTLWSSVPTATGLWVLAGTLWTLDLRAGPLATAATAIMWSVLAAQGIIH